MPGSREDCPICYVTLPVDSETAYKSCCGKSICIACILNLASTGNNRCPFCNAPTTRGLKNEYRMLNERIEKYNDASAMSHLGLCLNSGLNGFPVDQPKAFEMYKRASAGGNIMSNYNLGNSYFYGRGVEVDKKKAIHHWQVAAIGGVADARYNLGCEDFDVNIWRAMRHFVIAAKCGHDKSLHEVKNGFRSGLVTKDEFEKTLRCHQTSQDETRSEQRDKVKARLGENYNRPEPPTLSNQF